MYPLRYLSSGYIFLDSEDDCDNAVDAMLETGYSEEFCLSPDFGEDFAGRLMEAGFLIMSAKLADDEDDDEDSGENENDERSFILLPKLHLVRSVLFFPNLHIKKSIRRFLPRYELRVDTDFHFILDKCVQTHGSDWLTPPLVGILKELHERKDLRARPVSFGVYREGKLKAGEFGVVMGRVYTSYSGYCDEDNAGTVQMILMTRWLEKTGFDFLDLGMPLDYKTDLGAQNVEPRRFVELFRAARY